jgi:hypothetical protein
MQRFHPLLFACLLRHGQLRFVLTCQILSAVHHAIGTGHLLRQTQVDTDLGFSQRFCAVGNLALQVDVPPATGVLGEASGLHGSLDGTRQPQAQETATKADGIPSYADGLIREWDPAKGALAGTPPQTTLAELTSPEGIFHADTLDRLGEQAEIVRRTLLQ